MDIPLEELQIMKILLKDWLLKAETDAAFIKSEIDKVDAAINAYRETVLLCSISTG